MNDVKMYNEEEVRRREREAFRAGVEWSYSGRYIPQHNRDREAVAAARQRFPITRKVPRVIALADGTKVKVEGGVIWSRRPGYVEWISNPDRIPDNVRRMVALLDRPYEEIEE